MMEFDLESAELVADAAVPIAGNESIFFNFGWEGHGTPVD
jgi:hypothetical protein